MKNEVRLQLQVNGETHQVVTHPMARLIDVLRLELGLCGTKEGCGEGECGACSVLVDDTLVNSCLVPVAQVVGSRIVTIEALADDPVGHAVQQSFIELGGAQCGICTPGMVTAAVGLLYRHRAEPAEVRAPLTAADGGVELAGNLCRCTGYRRIIDSVLDAARRLEENK